MGDWVDERAARGDVGEDALLADAPDDEPIGVEDLARRAGVSQSLLEALERQGLLVPRPNGRGGGDYRASDVETVRAGLALLESGVPLSELLALAREHDAAIRAVTERAVDLFARYVRDPLRDAGGPDDAVARMVDALQTMLPATRTLVVGHFHARLLAAAQARISAGGRSVPPPDAQ